MADRQLDVVIRACNRNTGEDVLAARCDRHAAETLTEALAAFYSDNWTLRAWSRAEQQIVHAARGHISAPRGPESEVAGDAS